MDCRGHETRERICQEYVLKPLTFTVLLSGQEKYSCASHSQLTDRYYTFEYESKSNPNDRGTFFVGEPAGRDFIEILKKDNPYIYEPLLFNPLASESTGGESGGGSGGTSGFQMTKLNKELYTIINILSIVWNKVPYGNIQSILEFCATAKIDTQEWAVSAVNNLVGKDAYGRSIKEMVQELEDKGNKMKKGLKFDKAREVVKKNG